MLNHVCLQGRLAKEPELRKTQSDVSVANFTIAVERNYKDRDSGERQSDFFYCVAWRWTAELVQNYFHKGDMIVVSGYLQNNRYTDKNGVDRISTEVIAESAYFCGSSSKRDNGDGGTRQRRSAEREASSAVESGQTAAGGQQSLGGYANSGGFAELTDSEDDLPFD